MISMVRSSTKHTPQLPLSCALERFRTRSAYALCQATRVFLLGPAALLLVVQDAVDLPAAVSPSNSGAAEPLPGNDTTQHHLQHTPSLDKSVLPAKLPQLAIQLQAIHLQATQVTTTPARLDCPGSIANTLHTLRLTPATPPQNHRVKTHAPDTATMRWLNCRPAFMMFMCSPPMGSYSLNTSL